MTKIENIDPNIQAQFHEVLLTINQSKNKAYRAVNKEVIGLYWQIGEYISKKVEKKL